MGTSAEYDKNGRLRSFSMYGWSGGTADDHARHYASALRAAQRYGARRSPWVAGSFYLVVAVVVLCVLMVLARVTPVWSIPVVVVGGVLLLTVIGAFQLRQDDRLSERGFLKLMAIALGKLPTLVRGPRAAQTSAHGESSGASTDTPAGPGQPFLGQPLAQGAQLPPPPWPNV